MSDQLKFLLEDFLHIQDDQNTSPVTEKYTITPPPTNVALFADLKIIL